jgi:ribosome-associated protein
MDMRKLSSVADYFVVISGNSEPHVRAIADEIEESLRVDYDLHARAIDGIRPITWLILDYVDVVVHVMRSEVRERYNLEALWGDAPRVRAPKAAKPAEAFAGMPAEKPAKPAKPAKSAKTAEKSAKPVKPAKAVKAPKAPKAAKPAVKRVAKKKTATAE